LTDHMQVKPTDLILVQMGQQIAAHDRPALGHE
jgi:hypothetical protein